MHPSRSQYILEVEDQRVRRKFDVYPGGRADDVDRRVH
jgi:hypothetical protein